MICDFIKLSYHDRASETWERGIFITDRINDTHKFLLFSLDDFFVEVVYCNQGYKIEDVKAFNSTKLIELYLENINIGDIQRL